MKDQLNLQKITNMKVLFIKFSLGKKEEKGLPTNLIELIEMKTLCRNLILEALIKHYLEKLSKRKTIIQEPLWIIHNLSKRAFKLQLSQIE